MSEPSLSVVVLTRNRGPELLRSLERLAALPERPPVIVVDDASTDGSPARVAAAFPEMRLIALPRSAGAAGRTAGVRAAATRHVAFCDDDSWWEPGALSRAVELLDARPRLGLLAARVLVGSEQRLEPACAAMEASPLEASPGLPGPRVLGFVACGAIVRRSAYLQAGGFHPRFGVGGEESLLAADMASAGWELAYADELVAHHHPSPVRDREGRRAGLVRNDLWVSWLRRSPGDAARATAGAARAALTDPAARRGLGRALSGAAWAAAERRPVAAGLEAELRRLETAS